MEYMYEEDPHALWTALKNWYEQHKAIILLEATHEWNHLRLQDFKSVDEFNHAVHKICSKLRFCEKEPSEADKIEKTVYNTPVRKDSNSTILLEEFHSIFLTHTNIETDRKEPWAYCMELKSAPIGYLLQKGYSNNDDCPCVFIKRSSIGFCIISVYVDDLNIIGNTQDIDEARKHLKTGFEMKDLSKTKFCLGLQVEHLHSGILMHQYVYVQKLLEKFNMDKTYPNKTPMVVQSLDKEKDIFQPREEREEI